MLPLPLLLIAAVEDASLLAAYRDRTAAERPCQAAPDSTDVTVCGRRRADRFRVPFVGADPGDPRHEGALAERERLLKRRTPIEELGPFLVGGGAVGVTVTTGRGQGVRARTLAP